MSFDDICLPASPVVRPERTVVSDGGELSRGFYYYAVTAVGFNSESFPSHLLQIHARHSGNQIVIRWEPVEFIEEYRVYRGTTPESFDGYFTVYGSEGYFCDNGLGALNQQQMSPCP